MLFRLLSSRLSAFSRSSLTSVLLALSCAAQPVSTAVAASGLNDLSDGGASVYAQGSRADAALVPADLARRFPVGQRARIHVIGGGVRGFGLLAEFGPDGPDGIVVARETKAGGKEPYTPFALARVFDPAGNLVAVEDFTDQKDGRELRILKPTVRQAGIWRVSFSGGRAGDQVEIRLPQTAIWGVRGEMALGVGETTLRPGYLWIPPSAVKLLVGIETGATAGIELRDAAGQAVLAAPEADPLQRTGRLVLPAPPRDGVVRLVLPASFKGALVIEGAPGLLCPTEEAARRLRGGVVESHGVLTAGPLQARAREWMIANAPQVNREPVFSFIQDIPAGLQSPQLHALMFGKYGFANTLAYTLRLQNQHLDPADPFLGTFRDKAVEPGAPNWTNFWMPVAGVNFEPAGLAAAVVFDSPLNAARHNQDLIRRATLGAFANFMSMQGDNLLREGSLEKTRYPMTHSFFIYPPALAQSYHDLRDLLDPEAKAIWREGLIAVGDKLADYQGYQSNQWSHMILGHLETYLGTGEKRFLRYFERLATAFFDNTFGPGSKFGQHPAGFFLEENGPDGNYDHLSAYCLVSAWYYYRELPEANPALVEKIRAGIEKNIRFSSFFWLPDPAGGISSPTAFNCRTTSAINGLGYPGMIMAKSEFPLGLARFNLTRSPEKGIGSAATFSFVANTDAWALDVIRDGLRRGPGGFEASGGAWVPHLYKTYSQPARVQAAVVPVAETGGTWTLPGLLAWNRQGLYGVVFADVAGARQVLNGFAGGGPAALWTQATGAFLLGTAPGKPQSGGVVRIKNQQTQTDDSGLTFSCVYGQTADGTLFYSGKERTEVKTLADGRRYETEARLTSPQAGLVWRYELQPDDLKIEVSLKGGTEVKESFVNLPLRSNEATQVRLVSPQSVVIETTTGEGVRLEWPAPAEGRLLPSVHEALQRLVIPLPSDGKPLQIRVVKVTAP